MDRSKLSELLDRVIERMAAWPVLLLGLFRPEFQPPWIGQPQVTLLSLSRLDQSDTATLVANVANVAGYTALPSEIVNEIAERTDGVPLFVEELTKAVLEAGAQASAALSAVPHPVLSVPPTLHASLMARLDRLGSVVREVAQAGATIGREFGYELLASIAGLPQPRLHEALDRLSSAGLVFARGAPPEASYLFKHALVQDAAYGSLLRGRRQALHRRIVATLEECFPETVAAQPALLAQHCQESGLAEQAVNYWLKASQQALARSAMVEGEARVRKGLAILPTLPDGPWRRQRELDLQLSLGSALTATKGFSASETVETLARTQALAEELDRPEHLVPLMVGQWSVRLTQAEYRQAVSLGKQVEDVGEVRNDVDMQVFGRLLQGIPRHCLGELVVARALLEEHSDLAHPPVDRQRAQFHILRLAFAGLTLAFLGYIDRGRSRIGEAVLLARWIRDAPILAQTLVYANALDLATGSPLIYAEELLALSTEQKFPQWMGWGLAYRGLALAASGQAQEACALLIQAVTQLRAIGVVSGLPGLLARLANVFAMLGRPAEAWNYLTEAAQMIEATDERRYEAEVRYRVPGDLLTAAGDQSGAERHYRQAIAVAERQSAKLLQLRAATSLARLWRDQERRTEAYDLRAPIFCWFTEGFDVLVLEEAKALLDELA
jgi:tetratricopeptide (TPR) repeat protein